MDADELQKVLLAGFQRFLDDGVVTWNQDAVARFVHAAGSNKSLSDPQVQKILDELELQGHIRLRRQENAYLDVLG